MPLLWHSHSWLCSWVSLFLMLSSRPEWPIFSSVRAARTSAMERRDHGNTSTRPQPLKSANLFGVLNERPAERQPAKNLPPNPKPLHVSSLPASATPRSSEPPAPSARSAAFPRPSPADASRQPLLPPKPPYPPTLAPARSTHPRIAPPASPCSTPRRISATLAPIATLPPSRKPPAALPSSAARTLFLLSSALAHGDIAPPSQAIPTPPRSIPPAAATSSKVSSLLSRVTSPLAPLQFRAAAPKPASPFAIACPKTVCRPLLAEALRRVAAPAASLVPLFRGSRPAPLPWPAAWPSRRLPDDSLAAALLSIPARAGSHPCSIRGILPAAVRAPPQSVPSIALSLLPARRPPHAQPSPPARPGRALRPGGPAPASDSLPNSHTARAADSPPCIEISSLQSAAHATAPASPSAAPTNATLFRPATVPAPGSSPPGCSAQPPAPCVPALARNSSTPSYQTFLPPAAPLHSLPSRSSAGVPATARAPHRSRFPVCPPTLPALACLAALPTAGKVFFRSFASQATPDPDPPLPSPPPATGTSATPRANHAPRPRPAPSAPLPAPSGRAPSNTSGPAAQPVSRELCFQSPYFHS